jgi:hypothetical protein
LTVRGLSTLLPIDTSAMDAKEDVPYSADDALLLLKNSTLFDQFVTDSLNNFEGFERETKDAAVKN